MQSNIFTHILSKQSIDVSIDRWITEFSILSHESIFLFENCIFKTPKSFSYFFYRVQSIQATRIIIWNITKDLRKFWTKNKLH